MRVTSTKQDAKRYALVNHDTDGRAIDFSWSQDPQSQGGALLHVDLRFSMDSRRVCLELTPKEAVSLAQSLERCLLHHPVK